MRFCCLLVLFFCSSALGQETAKDVGTEEVLESGESTEVIVEEAPVEIVSRETIEMAEKISADHLDWARAGLVSQAEAVGDWVDDQLLKFPRWTEKTVTGDLTLGRVLTSVGFLVLWLPALWGLVKLLEARFGLIRSDCPQTWFEVIVAACRKPLALLLTVYGLFFALSLSIFPLNPWLVEVLANGVYMGRVLALLWLIFNLCRAVEKQMRLWTEANGRTADEIVIRLTGQAVRVIVLILSGMMLLPMMDLSDGILAVSRKLLGMAIVLAVTFLIIRAANIISETLIRSNRLDVEENYSARKIHTQVSVIRKIVVFTAIVLGMGATLMLFEGARQVGASILASAGIAGIVIGFAAQKTLGNLLAGIQIALTQPIRLDDVVIVEGEWGWIEEITLTYVVVKVWDLRRLVLPITYFVEKPFQNWTRESAQIIGSIFLHTDYRVPMEALRKEALRLAETHPFWDKQVFKLQVTDSCEQTIKLRLIVSSKNSPRSWDLRCDLREGMLTFLQEQYPESLPRTRAEIENKRDCDRRSGSRVSKKQTPLKV